MRAGPLNFDEFVGVMFATPEERLRCFAASILLHLAPGARPAFQRPCNTLQIIGLLESLEERPVSKLL